MTETGWRTEETYIGSAFAGYGGASARVMERLAAIRRRSIDSRGRLWKMSPQTTVFPEGRPRLGRGTAGTCPPDGGILRWSE